MQNEEHETKRFFKESFEATMRFAELAVRSLLILNGGAALGLLTFASNHTKNGGTPIDYADAVCYFGVGAALSVLTAGMSYLAQYYFTHENEDWQLTLASCLRWGAIGAWLVSIILFLCGVSAAANSIAAQ